MNDRAAQRAERARAPAVTVVCNDADYFLRHRSTVVERLAELGYRVTVITGGRKVAPDERRGWKHVFVPIERFAFRPMQDLALAVRTVRHLRAERPRSVHLITLKPAVFSGLAAVLSRRLSGSPRRILVTVPGLGRLMSPAIGMHGWKAGAARRLVERVIGFLSSRPDVHFTFETVEDRRHWLDRGLVSERNSIVINGAGVDPGLFYPSLGRPPGSLRILFASRLLKSKGLEAFLEVARRLSKRTDCEFIVAGIADRNDPDGVPPERLARERAVSFLGEVKDMPRLLREVDLVCLPTLYGEGIPRILIEAAASGLPCLATDHAGCREVVRDGESGVLFPPGSTSAMAEAMQAAIETYLARPGLLQEHGRAALQTFRSGNFDERDIVNRFIELLAPKEADCSDDRSGPG